MSSKIHEESTTTSHFNTKIVRPIVRPRDCGRGGRSVDTDGTTDDLLKSSIR